MLQKLIDHRHRRNQIMSPICLQICWYDKTVKILFHHSSSSLHLHQNPPSADAAMKQLQRGGQHCWVFAGCCILCSWQQTKWNTETQQASLACSQAVKWSHQLGCSQHCFSCQVSREEINQACNFCLTYSHPLRLSQAFEMHHSP